LTPNLSVYLGHAAMTTHEIEPGSVSTSRSLERRVAQWRGLRGLSIKLTSHQPLQFQQVERCHLLVALEQIERYCGETTIAGLPKSSRRDLARKLTFIPAGCPFSGWMKPRVSLQATLLYIDPDLLTSVVGKGLAPADLRPRLYFEDASLWQTVSKLKREIEAGASKDERYAQALVAVLAHEIVRLDETAPELVAVRGGLAAWQQRRIAEYIEEHLAEDFPLTALAGLAGLSTYHFARAFKRSFGIPPHRYHTHRRIERAKALLAKPKAAVADVAVELGFSGASAFAATFRRSTGQTPTDYRRGRS
jgi:AraC family transcriptional regulator